MKDSIDDSSKQVELYIIGSALCGNEQVLDSVRSDDFEDEAYQKVYASLKASKSQIPPLPEIAKSSGVPTPELIKMTLAAHGIDLDYYLGLFKETALKREVGQAIRALVNDSFGSKVKAQDLIDSMSRQAIRLQQKGVVASHTSVPVLLESYVARGMKLEQKQTVSSGIPLLDSLTDGFTKGSLTYVGARTSMGKTTILLHFVHAAIKAGRRVAVISMEMVPEIVALKLLCIGSNVSFKRAQKGSPSEFEYVAMQQESGKEYYANALIESSRLPISKLKSAMRSLVSSQGVEAFYVDYLTLIKPDKASPSRHMEVDQISKGLQDIGQDLGTPIICAAQLNRRIATAQDKRPTLADFRESGSIEEDADTCILLHRPDYYDEKDRPGVMQLIVAKNRLMGELGTVELVWEGGRYKPMGSKVQAVDRKDVIAPKSYKDDLDTRWEI